MWAAAHSCTHALIRTRAHTHARTLLGNARVLSQSIQYKTTQVRKRRSGCLSSGRSRDLHHFPVVETGSGSPLARLLFRVADSEKRGLGLGSVWVRSPRSVARQGNHEGPKQSFAEHQAKCGPGHNVREARAHRRGLLRQCVQGKSSTTFAAAIGLLICECRRPIIMIPAIKFGIVEVSPIQAIAQPRRGFFHSGTAQSHGRDRRRQSGQVHEPGGAR